MTDKTIEYYAQASRGIVRILTEDEEYLFLCCWLKRWCNKQAVSAAPPHGYCAWYPGTALSKDAIVAARAERLAELKRVYAVDLSGAERAFLDEEVVFTFVEGEQRLEYGAVNCESVAALASAASLGDGMR